MFSSENMLVTVTLHSWHQPKSSLYKVKIRRRCCRLGMEKIAFLMKFLIKSALFDKLMKHFW